MFTAAQKRHCSLSVAGVCLWQMVRDWGTEVVVVYCVLGCHFLSVGQLVCASMRVAMYPM